MQNSHSKLSSNYDFTSWFLKMFAALYSTQTFVEFCMSLTDNFRYSSCINILCGDIFWRAGVFHAYFFAFFGVPYSWYSGLAMKLGPFSFLHFSSCLAKSRVPGGALARRPSARFDSALRAARNGELILCFIWRQNIQISRRGAIRAIIPGAPARHTRHCSITDNSTLATKDLFRKVQAPAASCSLYTVLQRNGWCLDK